MRLWRPQIESLWRYVTDSSSFSHKSLLQVQPEDTAANSKPDDTADIQPPPSLASDPSSSRDPYRVNMQATSDRPTDVRAPHAPLRPSHGRSQAPREAIVDIDQLRLDLKEVFEDYLAHMNAVVDRHLKRV